MSSHNQDQGQKTAPAELSIILGQLVAYFNGRAHADDLDILSFSLHHLFCCTDTLFQRTLPELLLPSSTARDAPLSPLSTPAPATRQQMWMLLKSLKMTLSRIEPLCQLLSDAAESILDTLDRTNQMPHALSQDEEQYWISPTNTRRWEQALTKLTKSLSIWQEYHATFTPFAICFEQAHRASPSLASLDRAFTVLLDSAGAIFGDIIPSFRTLSLGDDEATATLLFDLMQQADQLLVQVDVMIEPVHVLLEHFA